MVSPMKQASATAFSNVFMAKIVLELEKNYKMWKGVPGLSESLLRDLDMLACTMDDALISGDATRTAVARACSKDIRDLMHDIDDCIERFHHRVMCEKAASLASRTVHKLRTSRIRIQYAKEIKELKKRLEEARNRVFDRLGSGQSSTSAAAPAGRRGLDPIERNPVGMAKPKEELLTLLDGPRQLRVISIVGFGGSGKTTLASTVFEHARRSFRCSAWVDRSDYNDARGLLKKIIQQVSQQSGLLKKIIQLVSQQSGEDGIHESEDQRSLENCLKDHVKNKRYLFVIDDIDSEHWESIRNTFEDNGRRSRIIVTTAMESVAKDCSGGNGYVHRMRKLGKEYSEKIALQGRCAPELVQGSTDLLKKCDGLPLALVSVADHLRTENEPTGEHCAKLCSHLGLRMENNRNFARLQNMLMDNYINLRDDAARTCFLYLGIFPNDRPLRRNVIFRRWLAEGYLHGHPLDGQQVADRNFEAFIDRNIIMPVGASSNGVLKTCKSHGVVHEFVLHKSVSEKFIMSFDTPRDEKVRHLFVHDRNGTNSSKTLDMDLKRVRSLTVFGNADDAISDFGNYELMRVLDLEQCSDVNNDHLKGISKLWNLRYLSLGGNINVLPKEIARLKRLETLHVSKTRVTELPVEVIGLPCLIHLIGKFKLPDQVGAVSIDLKQLSKDSLLETLVGFVANDQSQLFLQLIAHMKKLRKVKISCEFTGGSSNSTDHLSGAICGYMGAHKNCDDVRSLSIDLEKCSEQHQNFLRQLQTPCYLSSLKLRGELPTLPRFVENAQGLKELCLSSTTLTKDVLSAVSDLEKLLYLKLIAEHLDLKDFVIQVGAFKSLRRLRFVVQTPNPVLPAIQDGALPELVSLQLLCERLDGLSRIKIKHLKRLQEVALHPGVTAKARKDWEAAARKHPNRPNVLFFGRVALEESTHETPTQWWARLLIPLVPILVCILTWNIPVWDYSAAPFRV